MHSRYAPNEASCPVALELLALLLRSSRERIEEVVDRLPQQQRAALAAFAYGRSHMRALGLIVAAQCDERSLTMVAGTAGEVLFEQSRNGGAVDTELNPQRRKRISLSRVAA
jgi:adenosylmethionine-8-amino-7-oxononanoate aminotransferase